MDTSGQVSHDAFENEEKSTLKAATAGAAAMFKQVKNLVPMNISGMPGKAVDAVASEAKDAFKLPSFMSMMSFANPSSFSKPGSVAEAAKRLRQNLLIYKRNYISSGVLFFFLKFITSPTLFLPMLFVGAVWVYLLSTKEDPEPVSFGPIQINKRNKCIALAIPTFIFTWWMASSALIWCAILAACIAVTHGVFHTAPAHMKALAQISIQQAVDTSGQIPTHNHDIPNVDPLDTNAVDEEWWDLQ